MHFAGVGSRRMGAAVVAFIMTVAGFFMVEDPASAAIVPTVPLLTAGNYSVLAGTTVTNTGDSVLNQSLGVSPGTAITGFPPGVVNPPATTDLANGAAAQAQTDLTAAFVDASGRPLNIETAADLTGLTLVGGVYATILKGALSLSGTLTLDGENNPNSVFIFQTDSTFITSAASTVNLINGAQQCNVFWLVGSSATLGANSVLVGNILALTAITVGNNVTVQGRALARNAAVTLDDDTFNQPTCSLSVPTTTTTATTAAPTTTTGTTAAATTTTGTTAAATTTTGTTAAATTTTATTAAATTTTATTAAAAVTTSTAATITSTTASNTFTSLSELFGAPTTSPAATELPLTGSSTAAGLVFVAMTLSLGVLALAFGRRASDPAVMPRG